VWTAAHFNNQKKKKAEAVASFTETTNFFVTRATFHCLESEAMKDLPPSTRICVVTQQKGFSGQFAGWRPTNIYFKKVSHQWVVSECKIIGTEFSNREVKYYLAERGVTNCHAWRQKWGNIET
jgi:hypothetical protein